jgi:micrococcal nuclease
VKDNKLFQKIVGYVVVIGIIAIIILLILHFQNPGNKGKYAEDIENDVLYKVIDVLDGDTIVANVKGHEVTVRLIGIDTPEVVDPRKPVQCYGREASAKAKEILKNQEIYIEKDELKEKTGDYDIYGRVLAYIYLSDRSLYNRYMIENGYAKEYTFNKEKYKYQKEFKALQTKAKKEKLGLWGKCTT